MGGAGGCLCVVMCAVGCNQPVFGRNIQKSQMAQFEQNCSERNEQSAESFWDERRFDFARGVWRVCVFFGPTSRTTTCVIVWRLRLCVLVSRLGPQSALRLSFFGKPYLHG